jgi:hypothetical protein
LGLEAETPQPRLALVKELQSSYFTVLMSRVNLVPFSTSKDE